MSDPHRYANHLDAAVVLVVLLIVGGVLWALATIKIPSENLAVLAGLSSGLVGTVIGGYAGFRWGSSQASKPQVPGTMTATIEATTEAKE